MVAIVDYGLGNLRSVLGAVMKVGFEGKISADPDELRKASKLILPGVGAFGDGMRNLESRGLIGPLQRMVVEQRVPILGICLGAQLMARDSNEFGEHRGLGWVDAVVRRVVPSDAAFRVPHVGWNAVRQTRYDTMFHDVPQESLFYFVHSYHVVCGDGEIVRATMDYSGPMTAAFRSGSIWGTQFHPEKSQRYGLALLANFLRS